MKILSLVVGAAAIVAALLFATNAFAWHASGVSRDCAGTVTIAQSNEFPGAYVVSDDGSTVVIGWNTGETQTFSGVNKPEDCVVTEEPPVVPPRVSACPDGLPPTQGEAAIDPNDDCVRAPVEETKPPLVIEIGPQQQETVGATPVAPPSTVAPVATQKVVQQKLEKALEKQSKGVDVAAPGHEQAASELPYTGFSLWMAFALGGLLVLTGLILRYIGRVGQRRL